MSTSIILYSKSFIISYFILIIIYITNINYAFIWILNCEHHLYIDIYNLYIYIYMHIYIYIYIYRIYVSLFLKYI